LAGRVALVRKRGRKERNDKKKIEAIIDPVTLHAVKQALAKVGATDLTVSDVRGIDWHGPHREIYRGLEYQVGLTLKLKLEAIVDDWCLDDVAEALTEAAAAVPGGVSRVFVTPIEEIGTSKGEGAQSVR
jgi:nitrogen regulatory protein P-II 1